MLLLTKKYPRTTYLSITLVQTIFQDSVNILYAVVEVQWNVLAPRHHIHHLTCRRLALKAVYGDELHAHVHTTNYLSGCCF
jgi:hypothetical protein